MLRNHSIAFASARCWDRTILWQTRHFQHAALANACILTTSASWASTCASSLLTVDARSMLARESCCLTSVDCSSCWCVEFIVTNTQKHARVHAWTSIASVQKDACLSYEMKRSEELRPKDWGSSVISLLLISVLTNCVLHRSFYRRILQFRPQTWKKELLLA